MLKNYLTTAFRNLAKNSTYSFINISGLSVGLACSILILLWVTHELSYDNFHPNADRVYQVWINGTFDGTVNAIQTVPFQTKDALKEEDSRIKNTALGGWGTIHLLAAGDKKINTKGQIVSEEYLEIFQFPLIQGAAERVLDDPASIVITESTAQTLFGKTDPIGQLVTIDNNKEVKVTGVLKDIPGNSSIQFNFLLPVNLFRNEVWVQEGIDDWGDYSWLVYLELQPGAKESDVEASIKDLLTKKGQTDVHREFFLHPLPRWRLHSDFKNGKEAGGNIDYVQGFTLISVFILLIACINFMNLATARSEGRAREVGIRKAIGSRRKELIFQFLGESTLMAAISFVVAIALVELTLPLYNNLVDKNLFINYSGISFWIFAVGMILLTGILSGSYPAFYLSSFLPVKVLKGKFQAGKNATTPRQVLVVVQFVAALGLIIGTVIISLQIKYTKMRQLGYDQENLVSVWHNEEIRKNYKTIKQELLSSGVVAAVTKSNSPVTDVYANNFMDWPGKPADQKVLFATIATEYDYTSTMGIKVIEGRDFSEDFKSDTAAVLVNKAAADMMGLKETVGSKVTFWGERTATIVGVVDNVLMESPHAQVRPLFIVFAPDWVSAVSIRLEKTNNVQAAMKKVEGVFKKYNPSHPFEYAFADEQYARKFATITMINRIANLFAFLAIFITSLGVFGLAAFTAEQRTKEIGIRKVMGASVSSLVALIVREFSRLVIIAFIIATPLSWWGFQEFLEQYAYRIEFPFWVIGAAGVLALIFTLIIVGLQALKAAVANPVHSLRAE